MKRRDFLKTTGIISGAALTGMNVARSANAAGSDLIKIGLVGCGGRGMGALKQRLTVGDNVKLVAIADVFEEKANTAYKSISEGMKGLFGDKIALTKDKVFSGFDAYKGSIDNCDQVLIATTPAFRPTHYRYAVEKGKHVFMEKPCCIDAPGFRSLMESNKIADEKGLVVVVGFQRHYDPSYQQFFRKVCEENALGDLMYSRVYWNGGGIWERGRMEGDTEMKYQLRNWYHFNWLCGDNICEQHVHNLDVANWIHGKGDPLCHPVKANGMGGRQVRKFPRFKNSGYRWDHFAVEFTYADGSQAFSQCRHQGNCWNSVEEFFIGTNAYGRPGQGGNSWVKKRGTDELLWTSKGKSPDSFQTEHNEQAKFIREGKKVNNGWYGAISSFTAVFGRMVAMSGKELTWDEAVNKGKAEFPVEGVKSWDQIPPIVPDKNPPAVPAKGEFIYEESVPIPGIWKWSMD
ncbi:MAG: Gfo/Idh/MocA family oxidoreductase [Planctomycetia bacterium]|nr:Gfo/Idh/MocA family oxidoreductase [Planctomycetia bacterium]